MEKPPLAPIGVPSPQEPILRKRVSLLKTIQNFIQSVIRTCRYLKNNY